MDVFAGRYEVLETLGFGQRSVVVKARQLDLGRLVAVKILTVADHDPRLAYMAEKRMVREARLVSQLRSPNTVTLHDFGRSDDGRLYLVFEFIEGETLAKRYFGERAPIAEVVRLTTGMLMSLAEAHRVGVVHRDLKPTNVMVDRGDAKVLDFGIAKSVTQGTDESFQTVEGLVLGTPGYMSPEQTFGAPLSPRSDLFNVGLIAYELITADTSLGASVTANRLRGELEFVVPEHARSLEPFLRAMLRIDSRNRPNDAVDALSLLQGA